MLMERGKDQVSAEEGLAKKLSPDDLGGPLIEPWSPRCTSCKRRGLNDLLAASLGHCGYNRTVVPERDRNSFSFQVNAINCLWSFSLIQLIF